jgi:isoquinoline 1-oxidoreductase alpha subunit
MTYSLTINGQAYTLEAKPDLPLVWALRDLVGRNAVMIGCGRGNCGACTVRLNGEIIHSCQMPVEKADGAVITTPGYKPPT